MPAPGNRITNTFDYWLYGVPVIIPNAPGDFSEWIYAVPCVDIGASVTSFTGNGIAKASAALSFTQTVHIAGAGSGQASAAARLTFTQLAALSGSGGGQASASAAIHYLIAVPARGTGAANASAKLGFLVSTPATGTGASSASAALTAKISLYAQGAGAGVSVSSAVLNVYAPPLPGHSRIASPRQPSFRTQNYAAHSFAYRKAGPEQERVRHLGD